MSEELNNKNYFSIENNMKYMGASQFKDFLECEVEALMKAKGEYVEPKTDALLIGSYVDAYFSNELDEFMENTPEILDARKKEKCIRTALQQEFKKVTDAIENDNLLMHFLSGKKQVVMVGKIANVPFKIKVDSLLDDYIVDQKIISSIYDKVWQEDENGRNVKVDFVKAFGYAIQGAIYQEIVFQNIGRRLPFILAVTTKEENPDKALINIDQDILDKALKLVEEKAPRFDAIKNGIIIPKGCGHCACCRKDKKLDHVINYKELFSLED